MYPTKVLRSDEWVDLPAGENLIDGEVRRRLIGGSTVEDYYSEPVLSEVKVTAIAKVNPEAARRFKAIDYKKERAEEQPELYSLPDALTERQALRDASNVAQADIELLTNIEDVEAFNW